MIIFNFDCSGMMWYKGNLTNLIWKRGYIKDFFWHFFLFSFYFNNAASIFDDCCYPPKLAEINIPFLFHAGDAGLDCKGPCNLFPVITLKKADDWLIKI